jgi:hypothetical protein
VGGGGEPGHVEADLGEDHLRRLRSDTGDLIEADQPGPHRCVRADACVRAGGAVGVHALGGGHGGDQRLDPFVEPPDLGVGAGPDRLLPGLPELTVEGLPDEDAGGLLAATTLGHLDQRVRDRLIAETDGNPLQVTVPASRSILN